MESPSASPNCAPSRLTRLAVGLASLLPCLLVGCNSGKQMQWDLYTRDLRLQEDEIYRLEDCIEEYQAIVCSLRKENELLKSSSSSANAAIKPKASPKKQTESLLDDSGWSPDRPKKRPTLPDPEPIEDEEDTPEIELPSIGLGEESDEPPAPNRFTTPPPVELPEAAASDAVEPLGGAEAEAGESAEDLSEELESIEAPPFDSIPDVDVPEVGTPEENGGEAPPFQGSLLRSPNQGEEPIDLIEELPAPALMDSAIHVEEAPVQVQQVRPVISLVDDQPVSLLPATNVQLECFNGPREATGERTLVVQVRPVGPIGQSAGFRGSASLMLRDSMHPDSAAKISRWDYSEQEVAAAWLGSQGQPYLDLALILPEGVPTTRPLELWIRLVRQSGEKLLARCEVHIGQPRQIDPPADAKPVPTLGLQSQTALDELIERADSAWTSRTAPTGHETASGITVLPYHGDDERESLGTQLRLAGFEESVQEVPQLKAVGPTPTTSNP